MKVFFNRVPRTDPYGGGNQFLQMMTLTLAKMGHQVVYHLEKDIDLIFEIKNLLYDEKFTIEGARKMLTQPIIKKEPSQLIPKDTGTDKKTLMKIRTELKSILDDLQK